MRKFTVSALAVAAGLSVGAPAMAQEGFTRLAGESALQMASRINICGGASLNSATFVSGGTQLQAVCARPGAPAGMGGGLGTAAAVGGGIVAVAAIASNSGSSSSTTTTSASGTN